MIKLKYFLNQDKVLYLAAFTMGILPLLPMLRSGYIGDDVYNSLTRGYLLENNLSLLEYTVAIVKNWFFAQARFFPLAFYGYSLFFFTNLFTYKLCLFLLTILNIAVFGYFVKTLTRSTGIAAFSLLLPSLFFQFRVYHDPFLAYNGLLQLVFLYTLISLITLVFFLRKKKKLYLFISGFTFLLGLLTYEITILFSLLHVVVAYFELNRRRLSNKRPLSQVIKASSPFVLMSALSVLSSIGVRIYLKIPLAAAEGAANSGVYVPNPSLTTYLGTLLKQTSAAVPLSYYAANLVSQQAGIFSGPADYLRNNLTVNLLVFAFAYFVVVMVICWQISQNCHSERSEESAFSRKADPHGALCAPQDDNCLSKLNGQLNERLNIKPMILLGALLAILPGVMMSLSPKFQQEINNSALPFGVGYLPVYISYFGLLLVVLSLFYWAFRWSSSRHKILATTISLLVAATGAATVSVNYINNAKVVEYFNEGYLYPRSVIEEAIGDGFFQALPNDAYLLLGGNNIWESADWGTGRAFYRMHSGLKFRYVANAGNYLSGGMPPNLLTEGNYSFSDRDQVYFLSYKAASQGSGYAILGRLQSLRATNSEIALAAANQVYFYVKKSDGASVTGRWASGDSAGESFWYDEGQMDLVSSGDNWKILKITTSEGMYDLKNLTINVT